MEIMFPLIIVNAQHLIYNYPALYRYIPVNLASTLRGTNAAKKHDFIINQ